MRLTEIDNDLETVPLTVRDGDADGPPLRLLLHRRRVENGRPVLLLHGASAGSNTFLTPRPGAGGCPNLVDYLASAGYEPWLLDWRSSKVIADDVLGPANSESTPALDGRRFNFDAAAEHDIKAALEVISNERKGQPIDAIGFCMGGAILAQALLQNLEGVSERLSHVVLMTLGLFYSMNLHGRLKVEARLLERVASDDTNFRFLDPRVQPDEDYRRVWPAEIEALYDAWRRPYDDARLESAQHKEERLALQIFNRISFMFGEPYLDGDLVPEIHNTTWTLPIVDSPLGNGGGASLPPGVRVQVEGSAAIEGRLAYLFEGGERMVVRDGRGEFEEGQALLAEGRPAGRIAGQPVRQPPLLPDLFGAMAVHLHIHGSENLRAGQATRFSRDPVLPVQLIGDGPNPYAGFDQLDRTTLIGGALNRLWHRDSIDRMAAWLGRNRGRGGRRFVKHILPDYGHQDLLWSRNAAKDVFPLIKAGLGSVDAKRPVPFGALTSR